MNINKLAKEFHEQNKARYEEEFNKLPASLFDETTKSKALDFNFGSLGFEWHLRFTDKGFWSLTQYRSSIKYKGFGVKSLLCYFCSLESIEQEILKFSQDCSLICRNTLIFESIQQKILKFSQDYNIPEN